MDLLLLTGTKKKGAGADYLDDFVHFWSEIEKVKQAQVGVVNKKLLRYYINDNAITERFTTTSHFRQFVLAPTHPQLCSVNDVVEIETISRDSSYRKLNCKSGQQDRQ